MVRAAVFVSGGGTNFQALIDNQDLKSCVQIAACVSNKPGVFALERAEKADIPAKVFSLSEFGGGRDKAILSWLIEERIDMIILAGYLSMVGDCLLQRYEGRIINVHPSLIPSFCGKGYYGLRVHKEALLRGVKITGATVHFVNNITDGGEIILQKAIEVKDNDTPETLQQRVMEEAEWVILPRAARMVAEGIISTPQ